MSSSSHGYVRQTQRISKGNTLIKLFFHFHTCFTYFTDYLFHLGVSPSRRQHQVLYPFQVRPCAVPSAPPSCSSEERSGGSLQCLPLPEATTSEWRFQRQIKCGGTGETGLPVNTSAHEPYSAETEGLTVRSAPMCTWPPVFYLARLFVKHTLRLTGSWRRSSTWLWCWPVRQRFCRLSRSAVVQGLHVSCGYPFCVSVVLKIFWAIKMNLNRGFIFLMFGFFFDLLTSHWRALGEISAGRTLMRRVTPVLSYLRLELTTPLRGSQGVVVTLHGSRFANMPLLMPSSHRKGFRSWYSLTKHKSDCCKLRLKAPEEDEDYKA